MQTRDARTLLRKNRHGDDSGPSPGRATLTSRYLMRKERDDNGVADGADQAVDRAAASSGAPLPGELRERFEGSTGADLGDVRVHTGEASATANEEVGARAYTVGNDIHFGAGQYDPSSAGGQFLIAHEVAHTVQQSGRAPAPQYKLEVSTPGDAAEVEADGAADAMMAGRPAAIRGGGGIARKVFRETAPAPGGGGESVPIKLSLPEVKLAEKEVGPFSVEAAVSGEYEVQKKNKGGEKKEGGEGGEKKDAGPAPAGAPSAPSDGYDNKHADGKAETEVKQTASEGAVGVSAEVKKQFSALNFKPTLKGGVEYSNKKLKVGANCEFESEWGPIKAVYAPLEFTLLEWEAGKAPKFAKLSTSIALEALPKDLAIGSDTWSVKPSLKLELSAQPDPKEIAKWMAEHAAELLSAEAIVTVGLIAGGVLTIGTALYQIAKSSEFTERTEPEVKKCRAYCQGYANAMKGLPPGAGEGAAEGAAAGKARLDALKGTMEPGMVTAGFANHDFYGEAWAKAWPQVKARAIASYWEEHWLEKKVYGPEGAGNGGFKTFKMLLDGWDNG